LRTTVQNTEIYLQESVEAKVMHLTASILPRVPADRGTAALR